MSAQTSILIILISRRAFDHSKQTGYRRFTAMWQAATALQEVTYG
jgi:hypothetical protein